MQVSIASIKRLCATLPSPAEIRRHDGGVVKVECYDAPIILTREQTKVFLRKHCHKNVDPKIVDSIASKSHLFLVARSNLFGQINAPYDFECLHSIYKQFLQDLMIESNWDGLIACDNRLTFSNSHVILVKKMTSPWLDLILNSLEQRHSSNFSMKKIIDIGDSIDKVVDNIYQQNFGMFYDAPANASPIKIERDGSKEVKCEGEEDD